MSDDKIMKFWYSRPKLSNGDILDAVRELIAEEREACAKECDSVMYENKFSPPFVCADRIRARK